MKLKDFKKLLAFDLEGRRVRCMLCKPRVTENRSASNQKNCRHKWRSPQHPQLAKDAHRCDPPIEPVRFSGIMSIAAERSGINLGSWPTTEKTAENVRTLFEKSPLRPIGPIFSSCAGNDRPGYASRCTEAFWPIFRLDRSCWLTGTWTSMREGSTTSMNATPGRTWSPNWTSPMLPCFQIVFRTTIPSSGE